MPNQQCQSTEEYQLPEKLETGSLIAVREMSQNFTMPGEQSLFVLEASASIQLVFLTAKLGSS